MNAISRLALLLGAALAAVALTATPAAAQETSIEVSEEDATTTPCDPCQIHLVGESHVRSNITGALLSACEDDVAGFIDHNGTGELEWNGAQHTGTECEAACQAPEHHWPLSSPGELGSGIEHFTVRLCLHVLDADSHCSVELRYHDDVTPHEGVFWAGQECAGDAARFEATWNLEHTLSYNDEVEIAHL